MATRVLALTALCDEERGALLGASLLGLEDPVGLPVSARAWAALRALPKAKRAALLAAWIAELQAPFPSGMDRLHPSWVVEALTCEPEDLWPILLRGLPNAAQVRACFAGKSIPEADSKAWNTDAVAEMQRSAFAALGLLCVPPSGPRGASLCRLSCDELLVEVDRRGADKLREELAREGPASLNAVAGRLPAKLGRAWLGKR